MRIILVQGQEVHKVSRVKQSLQGCQRTQTTADNDNNRK